MRILICPDKFKGSLTATEAAAALRRGVLRALPEAEVRLQPLADGGEGSLEMYRSDPELQTRRLTVTGPLRRPVQAEYLLGGGRAVIESAAACGLQLVPPPRRHPKHTTTIGVGMLIDDALARGARDITLLLGGSSTNDCGAGMAAALGYRFLSVGGDDFVPMADSLRWVAEIDGRQRIAALEEARITAVCDVSNPLLGPNGATYTYAEQKGAHPAELPLLEENMLHFALCLRQQLGVALTELPGGGAAGGTAAGAVAFLGARLATGTEVLFELVGLAQEIARADLVLTGEGKVDRQTLSGKVVAGVIGHGRPTVVLWGRTEVTATELGCEAVIPLLRAGRSARDCMHRAAALLEAEIYGYLVGRQV